MNDFYAPSSDIKLKAAEIAHKNKDRGLEPEELAALIAKEQLDDYARLTDPAIPKESRSYNDLQHIEAMQYEFRNNIQNGQYKFVMPQAENAAMVASVELTSLVEQQSAEHGGIKAPRLIYDKEQTEPYRYDRVNDRLYVNAEQLQNPATSLLSEAMARRADRSPEQLTAELQARALEYAEAYSKPAPDRAVDRIKFQAEQEGWAEEKYLLRDAMVEASLPYSVAASDPAKPDLTQKARDELLYDSQGYAKDGVTEVTEETHPELFKEVLEGTQKLNTMRGKDYAPPTVLLVKDLALETGSPALYAPNSDTVQMDEDFVREQPDAVNGVLGHELGHRYQRSPEEIKATLHIRYSDQLG